MLISHSFIHFKITQIQSVSGGVGGALADTCLTDVFSLVVGLPNQCKGFFKKGPVLHPAGPSMTL